MPNALLIYASLTGNTKQSVDIVVEALTNLGVKVDLEESYAADAYDFESYDICLVGTYTWGPDGSLPDEAIDLYEELLELDLSDQVFGVFGSGDTFYEDLFCKSVRDFDQAFEKVGAKRGGEAVEVDLLPDEEDTERLQKFAREIVDTLND